jgi:hypothetical protein
MQVAGLVRKLRSTTFDYVLKPNQSHAGLGSHLRAVYLFAESITSEAKFWAIKCNYNAIQNHEQIIGPSTATMGDDPSNQNEIPAGVYYFETNDKSPFAKGK